MDINEETKDWYQPIVSWVKNLLVIGVPLEIIHFPSCGFSWALNRLAESSSENKHLFVIVDFKTENFESSNDGKIRFIEILNDHTSQFLGKNIITAEDENIYSTFEPLLEEFIRNEKKITFIFKNVGVSNVHKLAIFSDFISFLNRYREKTDGNVNFILTSSFSVYSGSTIAPVPILTRYFNFFDIERLQKTLTDDVFAKTKYQTLSNSEVDKLIEISGGLVVLLKSLVRDLTLYNKEISEVYDTKFDQNFFELFINIKLRLDRIRHGLPISYQDVLYKCITKEKLTELEEFQRDELFKLGILDNAFNVRGAILNGYLKSYIPKITPNKEDASTVILTSEDFQKQNYLAISPNVNMDIISGEIIVDNVPNLKYMSDNEMTLLEVLVERNSKGITRDEIGDILWGNDASEKYSDWAIDKTISRMREKLGDQKPYRIIKTVRQKGFRLASTR